MLLWQDLVLSLQEHLKLSCEGAQQVAVFTCCAERLVVNTVAVNGHTIDNIPTPLTPGSRTAIFRLLAMVNRKA